MSFTIGDGVTDYSEDYNDFNITFSHNTLEIKNEDVKEKVKNNVDNNLFESRKSLSINTNMEEVKEAKEVKEVKEVQEVQEVKEVHEYINILSDFKENLNQKVLFSVFQTESQEIEGKKKILFQEKENDTHDYFNLDNSVFQPKISGFYQINVAINCYSQNGQRLLIELLKNGELYKRGSQLNLNNENINFQTVSISTIVYLDGIKDFIEINMTSHPKFLTYPGKEFTWINGFFIN
jgi:hypothetical protein